MMSQIDVFNGDADGICGILQLRLAGLRSGTPITGAKRDISLLNKLTSVSNASIAVVDISFEQNRTNAVRLLESGCEITWFDHHFPGQVPNHPNLHTHINTNSLVCSSVIIDEFLQGQHRAWAIVAAFGDNLSSTALNLSEKLKLDRESLELFRRLGQAINYNAYGDSKDDLIFDPESILLELEIAETPEKFNRKTDILTTIESEMENDMTKASRLKVETVSDRVRVVYLPDEKWCRRVMGILANRYASEFPDSAHLLLSEKDGAYVASIRAPKSNPNGAQEIAGQFPTGGGREAAAGINRIGEEDLPVLINAMAARFF
jgi:single-stranded DNA-specific DHH superfamily exonuclease